MRYLWLTALLPLAANAAPVVTHQVRSATGHDFANYFTELSYDVFEHGEPIHIQEVTVGGQTRLAITDELGESLWESAINPRSPVAREQIEQIALQIQQTLDQRQQQVNSTNDDLLGDGL